jgi:hypothetical protein
MFHILRVEDDNEDCSIVVVVVILKELEWQLVKDLVSRERKKKKSDRDNYPACIHSEKGQVVMSEREAENSSTI